MFVVRTPLQAEMKLALVPSVPDTDDAGSSRAARQ
jgi:hypothetical protein